MLSVGDSAPAFTLQPVFGLPVALHEGTTVIAFLRPLTGSTARTAINTLTEAWPRFDAEGIKLIAVTHTDLTFARDFVPRHHVLFPIYVDASGEVARAYQVPSDKGLLKTLTGLRPRHLSALGEALAHGRQMDTVPSTDLPAYIVARDGHIAYVRYGATALDQPEIEELWRAATS